MILLYKPLMDHKRWKNQKSRLHRSKSYPLKFFLGSTVSQHPCRMFANDLYRHSTRIIPS